MNIAEMHAAIEAVLFATGRAVSAGELGRALETDPATARRAVRLLAEQWNEAPHGTMIIELDDAWQMCTRQEYYPQLIALELQPTKPKLTDVLLETLSVIAYKQPVTKTEIERIRAAMQRALQDAACDDCKGDEILHMIWGFDYLLRRLEVE